MDEEGTAGSNAPARFGRDGQTLAKSIFDSDVPEAFVQKLPAQSLYMAIQSAGPDSAGDLISLASQRQYSLLLDFELWNKDRFSEDNFWNWLSLIDESDSLLPLHRLTESIDRKIIAVLIAKYVRIYFPEEPNDQPPGPCWYTPDNGNTWIEITVEDKEKHRLLGKLLAFLFETNVELFYQLISIPLRTTPSELEEGAFERKSKRLLEQGIPLHKTGWEINQPISLERVSLQLEKGEKRELVDLGKGVEPVVYSRHVLEPLGSLLRGLSEGNTVEQFEAELTHIANASIVFFRHDFSDEEGIAVLLEKIRGAVNIGLQRAGEISHRMLSETYEVLGLKRIYQLGLYELFSLRDKARAVPRDIAEAAMSDLSAHAVLSALKENFPMLPAFAECEDSLVFRDTDGKLEGGCRALTFLEEVRASKNYIKERFAVPVQDNTQQ